MAPDLQLRITLENFVPYSQQTLCNLHRPINLIAGPNGAGKTALLKGALIPAAAFTERSAAIRKRTLFKKTIPTRINGPRSFHETLFGRQNLTADNRIHPIPDRYHPSTILTHRRRRGSAKLEVLRTDANGSENPVGSLAVEYERGKPVYRVGKEFDNRLSNLDLILLEPDNLVSSFFVALMGNEFEDQLDQIPGRQAQARFLAQVLDSVDPDSRLIDEVHRGRFRDRYSVQDLFLSEALSTGTKKELLIYTLHLLKHRNQGLRDWIGLVLVDELGQGLHMDQSQTLCGGLKKTFAEDEEIKDHVMLVATTHSPSVYKFFNNEPELCNIIWVMREARKPPQVIGLTGTDFDGEQANQLVLEHLGMTIFELPKRLVFVEGRTDAEFYRSCFSLEETEYIPIFGANLPEVLPAIIERIPLSRERNYFGILDGAEREIGTSLAEASGQPEFEFTGYRGVEEFIFGIKQTYNADLHWNQIQEGVNRFNRVAEAHGIPLPRIDVSAAESRLKSKGVDGARSFLSDLKKLPDLYKFAGRFYTDVLPDESRQVIERIRSFLAG